MVFKLARTWASPGTSQAGQPSPGAGAQTTGAPASRPAPTLWDALRPTQGFRSFFKPSAPTSSQRGYPSPENNGQRRPDGSMPNVVAPDGSAHPVETPYFSRGAAAIVQNFGKVLTNPIGAGVVAQYRPQASYGGAGQYFASQIFWANQVVPTSVNLQGLYSADQLTAVFSDLQIQAVVRTTG